MLLNHAVRDDGTLFQLQPYLYMQTLIENTKSKSPV